MPRVSPEILRWARESAGLSEDDAARKLGFSDTKTRLGIDRLGSLESGAEEPSRSVLLRMSKHYRRPLVTFYLSSPPAVGDRGQDFRTLPHAQPPADSALVDALVRDIRARQEMVRAVLEADGAERLSFVGSLSNDASIASIVKSISAALEFRAVDFYAAKSPEAAFIDLRERVERTGTFVLLMSNLGSHHTSIEPEVFRGFALADPVAPFVVINDQDSKAAWSFTLLHEFAHIWLGQTGISAASSELAVERVCNDAASHMLLPEAGLDGIGVLEDLSVDDICRRIIDFSRPRNISYSLVAYRLLLSGRISKAAWAELSRHFREMWRRQKASAREKAREDDSGGPSYYVVRRQRLGNALLRFVRESVESGELAPTKAARILGVKARSLFPLLRDGEERRRA